MGGCKTLFSWLSAEIYFLILMKKLPDFQVRLWTSWLWVATCETNSCLARPAGRRLVEPRHEKNTWYSQIGYDLYWHFKPVHKYIASMNFHLRVITGIIQRQASLQPKRDPHCLNNNHNSTLNIFYAFQRNIAHMTLESSKTHNRIHENTYTTIMLNS